METIISVAQKTLDSAALCDAVESTLDQNKAQDINRINLTGKSSVADFLLIATGTSQRHLKSLAAYAQKRGKELGIKGKTLEGTDSSGWVILDLGDIIMHLFLQEARDLYDLESMWDPKLYKRSPKNS